MTDDASGPAGEYGCHEAAEAQLNELRMCDDSMLSLSKIGHLAVGC
jgi:hypothetical protein